MERRTLTIIRNDMRNYLELADLCRQLGETEAAHRYTESAKAMERELEALRNLERIASC